MPSFSKAFMQPYTEYNGDKTPPNLNNALSPMWNIDKRAYKRPPKNQVYPTKGAQEGVPIIDSKQNGLRAQKGLQTSGYGECGCCDVEALSERRLL